MSRPEDSRGLPSARESAIANIILYGGIARSPAADKKRGSTMLPRIGLPDCAAAPRGGYSPEVPTHPVSETSTVTPSGPVYFTSTLPYR